jgi:hypothetical protein
VERVEPRIGGSPVDWANARFVEQALAGSMRRRGRPVRVRVGYSDSPWPYDVEIERLGPAVYFVRYSGQAQRETVFTAWRFVRAYLYWLDCAGPEVERLTVNCSDGNQPSGARFTPSGPPSAIPLPDPHFHKFEGFAAQRRLAETVPTWASRSDEIVWRGSGNGVGRVGFSAADQEDPTVLPRVRLCLKLAGVAGTDVLLTQFPDDFALWTSAAQLAGVVGESEPEPAWLNRKFALDIDGYTNTWSNFLIRMLFGCCVLKVGSPNRQWYYDRLRPFEHYVPVRADLSDLMEQIEWVRSHPAEAAAIAEAGRRFTLTLDFERGKRDAVQILTEHWNGGA